MHLTANGSPAKPLRSVLVTGGGGFIGSHSVDYLLAKGLKVIVLDNFSSGTQTNLPVNHPDVQIITGDILDLSLVKRLVRECQAILHLAAIASVPQSIAAPIQSLQVNVQGFLHVLQALREDNPGARLVYASSAAVYGEAAHLPCDETQEFVIQPLSPYALEKATMESYAKLYARLFHLNAVGLRYFNVFGPRQDPHSPYSGVISRFVQAFTNDEEITIFGDGLQSRDFIYVADIAQANFLALTTEASGVCNIATGQAITLLDLIATLGKVYGKIIKIHHKPAKIGDIRSSCAKVDQARELLGFVATTSLPAGLAMMK